MINAHIRVRGGRFSPGDAVYHRRFGRGRIIEQWGAWTVAGGKPVSLSGERVFEVEFQTHYRQEGLPLGSRDRLATTDEDR